MLLVKVVCLCLAAARITRLIVADSFPPIENARQRVRRRWGEVGWQWYLATCPWCMGVWVSGAVTAVVTAWYGLPFPLLVWGAAAWAAGFLTAIEPHDPDEDE